MKKFLILIFLSVGIILKTAVASSFLIAAGIVLPDIHPAEAKYDKLMNKYATGLKAAFTEKDDNKTIVMVKKLNDELVTGMEAIKPEIESWIKGMTEADKEAFEKRVENKPYLKTIFQIMFDPEIGKRIEQNPELKAALDEGGKRMKALEVENGESEEGY